MAECISNSSPTKEDDHGSPKFPEQRNRNIFLPLRGFRPDLQPVWIMGQASEYLPEFRQMVQEYGYYKMLHMPELICEVTLMPIKRFHLDAAIIFSDILLLIEALGLKVVFDSESILPEPLEIENIETLNVKGFIDRLNYIAEAITITRHKLKGSAAMFGLAGAPWTIMTYLVEGKSSHTCAKVKSLLYAHKQRANKLLDLLTDVTIEYCIMQAKAGAQVIQIFESNAEFLNKDMFAEFCFPRLKTIRKNVKLGLKVYDLEVPMIIYAKGCGHSVINLTNAGYDAVSLDQSIVASHVISAISPKKICLQGNLDPCKLYAPISGIRTLTKEMLKTFQGSRFITNLGDNILPDTPLESVQAFLDTVRTYGNYEESSESDDESIDNAESVLTIASNE